MTLPVAFSLPIVFATLPAGDQDMALFDQQFAAVVSAIAANSSTVIRGEFISDALWAARGSGFTAGQRGPLFVWNNPSPTDIIAGKGAGIQVVINDNPTATPGAGDATGLQVVISNLNSRSEIWAADFVSAQDATGTDGNVRGIEVEVNAAKSGKADPFASAGFRKNGIEVVGMAGGPYNPTSALWVWANDSTGNMWWSVAIAISRTHDTGILFARNPLGATDSIEPFLTAAIYDKSNSATVLKIDGSHTNVFDVSAATGLGTFVRGFTGADTSLLFRNFADWAISLVLDSGSSATKAASILFNDQGTNKWILQKNNGNAFLVFDTVSSRSSLVIDTNATNAVQIWIGSGLNRLQVGAADSGGTGFRMVRVAN